MVDLVEIQARADVKVEESCIRQLMLDMGDAFQRKDIDAYIMFP